MIALNTHKIPQSRTELADYKFSTSGLEGDSYAEALKQCHERSAFKLQKLCFANGGIYIKLGQHVAQLVGQICLCLLHKQYEACLFKHDSIAVSVWLLPHIQGLTSPCLASCCPTLCDKMLCLAMLCHTLLRHTMLCHTMLCHTMLCHTIKLWF